MTLEEELIKEGNEEYLKMALALEDSIPKIRERIINDFFDDVEKELNNKLNTDIWKVEIIRDNFLNPWYSIIKIYKKNWENNIHIGFTFNLSNYKSGFFYVAKDGGKVNKGKIYKKFKEEINNIKYKQYTDFIFSTPKAPIEDMAKDIVSQNCTVNNFINSIIEMISNLENEDNNNLLTRINKYIQNDYKEVE